MLYQVSLFHPCVLNKQAIKLFPEKGGMSYQVMLFHACVLNKLTIKLFQRERGMLYQALIFHAHVLSSRPRWLSWMRRPTGDQEVAGSTPAEVGNILSWRLIMKYFLRSFSPFR